MISLKNSSRLFPLIIGAGALLFLTGCVQDKLKLSLDRASLAPVEEAPLRVLSEPVPIDGRITVREGDDIYIIANRYKVNPLSILIDNELSDVAVAAGQTLIITPRRTHSVEITDNMDTISQRYAVRPDEVAKLNGLTAPYTLTQGQLLILPDSVDLSVLNLEGLDSDAVRPQTQTVAQTPSRTSRLAASAPPRAVKKFVAPALGKAGFNWPLSGEVLSEYGPVAKGVHNDGINIAAPQGTPVSVTAAGTVAYVGENLKSFGSLVLVKHEGGYISAYAHLSSIQVNEGDVLTPGSMIGQVGQTGNVTSPQLHFEIRRARQPVNPRDLIAS